MIPFAFAALVGLFAIFSAETGGLNTDVLASVSEAPTLTLVDNPAQNKSGIETLKFDPIAPALKIDVVKKTKVSEVFRSSPRVMSAKKEVIEISEPRARTAMKFGTDDEKPDDWIK